MLSASVPPVSADVVIPPLRFSIVENKLYRGSYPRPLNFKFLESLHLKTVLSLTPEPLTEPILQWCRSQDIHAIHFPPERMGKKGAPLTHEEASIIVQFMLDATYAPLYVHCLNGSEVTGLAIASLRKLQFWTTSSIFSELMRFSESHTSSAVFIEGFLGEVEIPLGAVEWLWQGLKDDEGVGPLRQRVEVRYADDKLEELRVEKLLQLESGSVSSGNGGFVARE